MVDSVIEDSEAAKEACISEKKPSVFFEAHVISEDHIVTPDAVIKSEVSTEKKSLELWWLGPAADAGGYGKMNRKCVEGLYEKGVKIELDPFRIPDMRSTVSATASINEMMTNKVGDNAPSVWAIMPPKFLPRSGRKILYTMMESKGFHDSFLTKINNADEIWLPSRFNVDMFEEDRERIKKDSALRKNLPLDLTVRYMPLGVDTDLYRPMDFSKEELDPNSVFGIKTKSFVFSSLFGWSLRKGYDVLLRSYFEEFDCDDDVTLVIASRKDGSTNQSKVDDIRKDIKNAALKFCKDPKRMPHIVHIGQAMKEEHLPILYNMSDCFVLPSRGEGFGLIYAEAGACSVPVISTRCCGMLDFLDDDNSYLINIAGYDVNKDVRQLSSYYQNMPFAVLDENTVSQLKYTMRHVMDNYSEAKGKAELLRKNICENFTWDLLVDRIYNRIREF